jgi:single-strand DNA-binding protein
MINRVVLVGRLTKDIEVRKTTTGLSTATFTLACNRRFQGKDAQGPTADFINCVAWRQQADFLGSYAKKGSIVGVEGRITTRNYEGQNGRVYVTEVVCENMRMLENRNSNSNSTYLEDYEPSNNGYQRDDSSESDDMNSTDSGVDFNISEDDLPF